MLVVKMDKVLDRVDVPQRDRPRRIEPFPVKESVAVIAEDRWTIESRTDLTKRQGDIAGQEHGRLLPNLVHISGCEKSDSNVIKPDELLRNRT